MINLLWSALKIKLLVFQKISFVKKLYRLLIIAVNIADHKQIATEIDSKII